MTKHIQSHENNITSASINNICASSSNFLNPNATPFLDAWKSTILAKAKLLGIEVKPATNIDFQAISATIEGDLLQQAPVKHLQHIVDTSDDFETVLTAQEQLYLKKAAFYNIELDKDQWCALTDLHMFDAVDSWEKKLKEALVLGVNWRMNDYDPDGLELVIEQQEELCAIDNNLERRQANAYYYSTRGC